MACHHFSNCPSTPHQIRECISHLASNISLHQNCSPLQQYCDQICKHVGIGNHFPPKTGISMGRIDTINFADLCTPAIPTPNISMDEHTLSMSADKEGFEVQPSSMIPYNPISSSSKERKRSTLVTSAPLTTNRKKNKEVSESKTQTSTKQRHSYINISRGVWKCSRCLSNTKAVASSSWQGHSPPPKAFVDYHTEECTGPYSLTKNNPGSSLLAAAQLLNADGPFEDLSHVNRFSKSSPASFKEDIPPTSRKGLSTNHSHGAGKLYEPPANLGPDIDLVPPEDRRTITDQTAFVMQQMKVCYFDGRSANRPAGFPGLACKHCGEKRGGRKYFWSTANRFTNNGSTLTKHLEECKSIPDSVRERLAFYKSYHTRQMEILPRGCLGAYYRRMFLKIHGTTTPLFSWDAETNPQESLGSAMKKSVKSAPKVPRNPKSPDEIDAPVTNLGVNKLPGLDDKSGIDAAIPITLETSEPHAASLNLGHVDDVKYMSDKEGELRNNVEVFNTSREEQSLLQTYFPHFPIIPGTVGIRCIHCSRTKTCKGMSDFSAFAFPKQVDQLRPTVLQLSSHFGVCSNAPQATRDLFKVPISIRNKKITDNYYRDSVVTKFGFYDSNAGIKATKLDVTLHGWTFPAKSTEVDTNNTVTSDVQGNTESIDEEFNATSLVEALYGEARELQSEFQPLVNEEEAHKEMMDNCDELHVGAFSSNSEQEVVEEHGLFDHFVNINTVTPSPGTKRQLDNAQEQSPSKKQHTSHPATANHDDSFSVPDKSYYQV
uniref:Uncharacterized protein n=1 Tax=Chaetoceros debilis TaxID=122233 RepID=A0A7S3Q0Y0_9STRA